MRNNTYMALSLIMIASCMALILPASSEEQVELTIYVHEGDIEGDLLCCVQITGRDGVGNSIGGITDSDGAVTFKGQPGTWEFEFEADGYEPLYLEYDVTESHEAAAYLEKSESSSSSAEPVALTVFVHEGDLDGTLLSDVQITGYDGLRDEFSGITDSSGSATLVGQPGVWDFLLQKENYETLNLTYEVNETHKAAAYLQPA
jgi:hypothetical protein